MSKNSSYKVCPVCGANLDPAERCDCVKRNEQLAGQIDLEEEIKRLETELKQYEGNQNS